MPTNYERAFEERPEVLAAWVELNGATRLTPSFPQLLAPPRRNCPQPRGIKPC